MATSGQALSFKAGWLCLFAIVCFIWAASKLSHRTAPPDLISADKAPFKSDADIQIDMLLQVAATPGRVIQASQGDKQLFTYKCSDDDAAVAVFMARGKATGKDGVVEVADAKDPDGNLYCARLQAIGSVNVLVLKRGFAKRPDFVTVKVKSLYIQKQWQSSIRFHNISEPQRVLPPATPAQTLEGERIIHVKALDDSGDLLVHLAPLPSGAFAATSLLALSYAQVENPGLNLGAAEFYESAMTPYYSRSVDSAKLHIDVFKPVSTVTTLNYKKARIVQANGKNFLWLPTLQHVGLLGGRQVTLGNQLPHKMRIPSRKSSRSDQEIDVRFSPSDILADTHAKHRRILYPVPSNFKSGAKEVPRDATLYPPQVEFLDVFPEIAELPLDSLRIAAVGANVQLVDPTSQSNASPNVPTPMSLPAKAFKVFNAGRHTAAVNALIPELKIRVRMTQYVRASSRTLIVPVHHVLSIRKEIQPNRRSVKPTGTGKPSQGR